MPWFVEFMSKKGFSMSWIIPAYLLINIILFILVAGKINMNKDDTGYYLDYYSKDLAEGSEALLWADGRGSYSYDLREDFEVKIDNQKGKVYVKSGMSVDESNFRVRDGFVINIKEENNAVVLMKEAVV